MMPMDSPNESVKRSGLVELAVVAALVGLCAVALAYAGVSAVERARATEWFAQFAFIRQQTTEHFALTGEWNAPHVKELGSTGRTRCQAADERVDCELRGDDQVLRAGMTFRAVTTVGAINWACEPGKDPVAADGSRWFAVCGQKIHSAMQ